MYLGVQYLRAYAALLVLFFHSAIGAESTVKFGDAGVDVFFVISGFILWTITSDRTGPARFVVDRIARIVPIYWIASCAVFGAALLGLTSRTRPDVAHLLSSLAFLPFEGPLGLYPILNVGWTLNYEMFFYSVLALAMWALPRRYIPAAITVAFGGLVTAGMSLTHPVARFYTNPIILEFAAGIWVAVYVDKLPPRRIGVAMLMLGLVGTISGGDLPRLFGYGIPALLCVAGMLAIERDGGVVELKALRLAGDASYSIYLWHPFAIAAVAPLFSGAAFAPVILFLAGMIGGLVGYYQLERPALRITRKPVLS